MNKIFRLSFSNIRKNKSQSISFLTIALISAMLLNIGLITWNGYAKSFDLKTKSLNAPDVILLAQSNESSFVSDFQNSLLDDNRIEAVEAHPILFAGSDFHYADGINSRKSAFFDRSTVPDMGKYSIVEENPTLTEHPIYLPYLFSVGGGYKINDPFTISLFTATHEKAEFTYTIAGFYEDTYFATINTTTTGFLLNHEEYIELEQAFDGDASGTLFSVKSINQSDAERIVSHFKSELAEYCNYGQLTDSNHYALLKSSRTVTSSIGSSIILGFSLLLLFISIIIVNFRIRNSVEEDIQNIGALKAIGYTSRQLISSLVLQFVFLGCIGCVLGILSSLPVMPALADMFASQTGVLWKQYFSPFAAGSTLLILSLLISVTAFASAVRIRRLPPIVALRTGIETHSFRRNPFPLEHAHLPFILSMAGKQLVRNIKQNLLIGLIVTGITFAAVFAGVLFYNSNIENDIFIRMVSGEISHIQLESRDGQGAQRLLERVQNMNEVEKAYYYDTQSVNFDDSFETSAYIVNDFDAVDNPDWLYKGRFPKYDNEVALSGLLAGLTNKQIGDTIHIKKGSQEQDYLITGFIQGSNSMGRDLCMNVNAYRRISKDFESLTISVYLKDNTQAAEFIDTLKGNSDDLLNSTNMYQLIRSSMASYQLIITVLTIIITIVTLVIICLVLYLVIKTLLIRKKLELGIQKAIGFTTKQLVLQNALSYFPVIVIGAFLGCVGGHYLLNPFFSILFSSIGIMKVFFVLSAPMIAAIFAFIILFGFLISIMVSYKIKHISPYTLMSE